jgi:hypothetical protein
MKNLVAAYFLISLFTFLSGCSGAANEASGEQTAQGSNWDQMQWDQGKWGE